MSDAMIVSDPYRPALTAQRIEDGRVMLRTPGRPPLFLSPAEIERLADFASNRARIQRFAAPTTTAPD